MKKDPTKKSLYLTSASIFHAFSVTFGGLMFMSSVCKLSETPSAIYMQMCLASTPIRVKVFSSLPGWFGRNKYQSKIIDDRENWINLLPLPICHTVSDLKVLVVVLCL